MEGLLQGMPHCKAVLKVSRSVLDPASLPEGPEVNIRWNIPQAQGAGKTPRSRGLTATPGRPDAWEIRLLPWLRLRENRLGLRGREWPRRSAKARGPLPGP